MADLSPKCRAFIRPFANSCARGNVGLAGNRAVRFDVGTVHRSGAEQLSPAGERLEHIEPDALTAPAIEDVGLA